MTSYERLKVLIEKRESLVNRAQKILTDAHSENRAMTQIESDSWENRHAVADDLATEITTLRKKIEDERDLDKMRTLITDTRREAGREDINAPQKYAKEYNMTNEATGYDNLYGRQHAYNFETNPETRAFRKFLTDGIGGMTQEERSQLRQSPDHEVRALSAVTGGSGAYSIPEGFVYDLEVALKYYGGILQAASYIDTDSGQPLPYPSINDTGNTGEQTAENSAVAGSSGGGDEQDPTYSVITFNAWMIDTGFVLVPIQLLQDSAFNIEQYLTERLTERLGRKLNTLCTTGAGTTTAKGVVTAATAGPTAASATAITYADLLALEHSVDPAYRSRQTTGWMFNDDTFRAIKGLVDGNGRPLFIAGGVSEGIVNKAPGTLMGYPYFINNDMADIAASSKSILFGDFSKYKIRRVRSVEMIRAQERFIDKMQIGFMAYQRIDGNLVDAGTHPIKALVQAAS